jgi:hypothetical protein
MNAEFRKPNQAATVNAPLASWIQVGRHRRRVTAQRPYGVKLLWTHHIMKKQLTHISPLKAGIVLGVLYGPLGLVAVPFFLLPAVFGSKSSGVSAAFGGVLIAVVFPVLYAVAGFIGGIIASAVYNLVAKWTGGLEFEVRDVPPAA